MRRPFCVFCLLTAAAIWISAILFPQEIADLHTGGQYAVTLTAIVDNVEMTAGETGDPGSSCRFYLRKIRGPGGEDIAGGRKILCYLDGEAPCPGDHVTVRGKLRSFRRASNEGEFDAAQYYSALGVCCQMTDTQILALEPGKEPAAAADRILAKWKRKLGNTLDHCFEEEDAGVMRAVLLGERGMADEELISLYRRGGILHLLVISGMHISLLGAALLLALKKLRIPEKAASAAAVTGIALYGRMAGMSCSVFRAVWMFGLRTAAPCIRRTYDLPTAAAAAAALLLCFHPFLALQSGFLYSFSAVFGIAFLAPAMPDQLSFAAIFAAVLPVQLWFYYGVAPFGFLLTLVFAPFLPVLLASGAGVCILFALSQRAALAVSLPARLILLFYNYMTAKTQLLPGCFLVTGRPAAWQVTAYYLVLFMSFYIGRPAAVRKTVTVEDRRRAARVILLRSAGAACAVMILLARHRSGLTVSFLDVGQGDGICIQAENCTILVDGGSSSRQELGESVLIPFLHCKGISSVDLMILSHEDYDHCSGMIEILEQASDPGGIHVGAVALPDTGETCRGEKYMTIVRLAEQKRIKLYYYSKGDVIRAGELEMECLHPEKGEDYEDSNEASGVFLLRYGNFSALLTGDLEGKGEEQVVRVLEERDPVQLTVLKAAHHGSAGATGEEFLKWVNAGYAVISCGQNNRYGHPAEDTLARLREAGCRILDTRFCGEISFHVETPSQNNNIWYNTVMQTEQNRNQR